MEENEIKGGGATSALSRDINVLTAEIKLLLQRIEDDAVAVGLRFKKVRDEELADNKYGNWGKWCSEEFSMDRSTANKIIKVFETFGNGATSPRLGKGKLFELIALPSGVDPLDFVEQPHTIPSTGVTKTVDEMTVRELREVKKALKEADEARKQAEAQRDMALRESDILRDTLESREDVEPEVRTEYPDVFA
ncbi:DUF3102 domain-containing protein [Cytobacillus sp. FSL R7-0680]|uniref:DUF3102 domain-containing protein n=1 Tax=Cytobacillus sp. FSL R7-0680 TaxID=2921689 RepID=UPI0030F64594